MNNFDINIVIDAIEKKDPFLFNSIFHNCFGPAPEGGQDVNGSGLLIDALFSSDCDGHLDSLRSYFMSIYGLPNLLVNSRLNVSRLSSERKLLVEQLLPRCLDLGFVSEDSSQRVLNLKEIGNRRMSKVKSKLDHSRFLHPLTLVIEEGGVTPFAFSSQLIKTNKLVRS